MIFYLKGHGLSGGYGGGFGGGFGGGHGGEFVV